jgi:hypothetical protein
MAAGSGFLEFCTWVFGVRGRKSLALLMFEFCTFVVCPSMPHIGRPKFHRLRDDDTKLAQILSVRQHGRAKLDGFEFIFDRIRMTLEYFQFCSASFCGPRTDAHCQRTACDYSFDDNTTEYRIPQLFLTSL